MKFPIQSKSTLILFVLFCLSGTAAADEDHPASFRPINGVEYDFGRVKQGEIVTHIFEFRNGGWDTLYIHNVKAP